MFDIVVSFLFIMMIVMIIALSIITLHVSWHLLDSFNAKMKADFSNKTNN